MQTEKSLIYSILEMIADNGGAFGGRTRIHKSAYLLKEIGATGFSGVRFDFDRHGPLSREISDALQEAIAAGLIEEDRENPGVPKSDFLYKFTTPGIKWLESNIPDRDRCVQRTLRLLSRISDEALALSSIVFYLEHEGYSQDETQAFQKALAIEPRFVPYQSNAEVIVRHIKKKQKSGTMWPSTTPSSILSNVQTVEDHRRVDQTSNSSPGREIHPQMRKSVLF